MKCSCCGGHRQNLHPVKSKLALGMNFLCTTCKDSGHEPRHKIIIAGRSGMQISKFINFSRYCGAVIEAREVIP